MGAQAQVSLRVVCDTGTVLSALLFQKGRLAWLRSHWRDGTTIPLISPATAVELVRVFAYPKFRLAPDEREELLADYLVYCETIENVHRCPVSCRDAADQAFLDLAHSGNASVLVTGDGDLLALSEQASFILETPAAYRQRVLGKR